jgi:CheY-like chemotaxis protein
MSDREILLVEDSPHDLEFTLRALKRHDLAQHVVVARDGAEALDIMFASGQHADRADRPRPRLVLLDLKLPKVDGIEVLRRFKDDQRSRRIPVVVMTSSAEEQDMLRSYDLGVNSYIVKPVEFDNFAQAVSDVGLYWFLLNRSPG